MNSEITEELTLKSPKNLLRYRWWTLWRTKG